MCFSINLAGNSQYWGEWHFWRAVVLVDLQEGEGMGAWRLLQPRIRSN